MVYTSSASSTATIDRRTSRPSSTTKTTTTSPSFWEEIQKIRTNSFRHDDSFVSQEQQSPQSLRRRTHTRHWTIKSRKSHILDTNGHFGWKRELNCFQGQSLPDALFPHNTLEILVHTDSSNAYRIRFGALEGLRGWMSMDSDPIPTTHALDSDHWKRIGQNLPLHDETTISSTSYDYTYTTPYKGGTDRIGIRRGNDGNCEDCESSSYEYLEADSTSFVAKHDAAAYDVPPKKNAGTVQRVKLRKPICKCKGDGGRAPFVSKKKERTPLSAKTNNDSGCAESPEVRTDLPPPEWKTTDQHRVDIEGMLQRASRQNPQHPFRFREDVDLWEDDLHDNGTAWLKVRFFVCQEGWACLLRNFVRVDGVLCRVLDTRYIHRFGEGCVYREHSWREGSWDKLLAKIQEASLGTTAVPGHQRTPPTHLNSRASSTSLESVNDSIAARYLPLKTKPITEFLSLGALDAGATARDEANHKLALDRHDLVMIHDASIEDTIPVPSSSQRTSPDNVSFVLKRSKGRVLEGISSGGFGDSSLTPPRPILSVWSKRYSINSDTSILSVRISPNLSDGGRLAIGDDSGWVQVWRLSTGDALWRFPVALQTIRDRRQRNPLFQSARLWVEHLVWSNGGVYVGAAAGRTSVIAKDGNVVATMESNAGTVTDLAFRNQCDNETTLAVASYGEVSWVPIPSVSSTLKAGSKNLLQTLKRSGAAVECLAISPNGGKIAVGFLDKTLRVFTTRKEPSDFNDPKCVDWVGFNAAVKAVRFHSTGNWLAAMGGTSILVIRDNLDTRREAPIVCRTPGRMKSDGDDGSCHRFARIAWSGNGDKTNALLAALDGKDGSIHVFSFGNNFSTKATSNHDDAWPLRALPIRTVMPSFLRPCPFANTTAIAFFPRHNEGKNETHTSESLVGFLVLDVNPLLKSKMHSKQEFETLMTDEFNNADTSIALATTPRESNTQEESFSYRIVH